MTALSGCAAVRDALTDPAVRDVLADPAVIDPSRPFQGSPSESYADGADGIVIPEAAPVGRFPASDVEDAYRTSKRLLVAAHLDRQTLLGGAPEAFTALLDRRQRKHFLKHLDSKDRDKDTRGWVTSFAPGSVDLVGDVIKVKSGMSAEAGKDDQGRPELWVNYTFRAVYPVRPKGADGPVTRVMAFVKARHEYWRNEPDGPLRHWDGDSVDMWSAGTECHSPDGFLRPDYVGRMDAVATSDAYDDHAPALEKDECGVVGEI
ncbi:hypothetical protein [Microtetraspora niveoalba]|uniref:hypothetical protein n=1 Tax=Microtetraspora niveoalba TaxID=46175 RepID=UPI0008319128|nr:hypothetical protein [Microtetraspora niveoalba]